MLPIITGNGRHVLLYLLGIKFIYWIFGDIDMATLYVFVYAIINEVVLTFFDVYGPRM